jgi:hypothetical protein
MYVISFRLLNSVYEYEPSYCEVFQVIENKLAVNTINVKSTLTFGFS